MGLFSNKEKVPEIPDSPSLPKLPEDNTKIRDLPELPTFPSTPRNEDINQEIVKSAVSDVTSPVEEEASVGGISPTNNLPKLPPIPTKPVEQPQLHPLVKEMKPIETSKEIEPIFVRIDKFQAAQKNFEGIKEKINDIESTIKKIREVKTKEEEELINWTKDIERIKSSLKDIDSSIFDQI